MDLPTYTSIWRIEKRLYKLYDFRLPFPVPVVTLGVTVAIFVAWAVLMRLIGVEFAPPVGHIVWIVPPLVLAFLATRTFVEGKRPTELAVSYVRYSSEAAVYCRLAPEREPREIVVTTRVWHRHPQAPPLPVVRGARRQDIQAAQTHELGRDRPRQMELSPELEEFPPLAEPVAQPVGALTTLPGDGPPAEDARPEEAPLVEALPADEGAEVEALDAPAPATQAEDVAETPAPSAPEPRAPIRARLTLPEPGESDGPAPTFAPHDAELSAEDAIEVDGEAPSQGLGDEEPAPERRRQPSMVVRSLRYFGFALPRQDDSGPLPAAQRDNLGTSKRGEQAPDPFSSEKPATGVTPARGTVRSEPPAEKVRSAPPLAGDAEDLAIEDDDVDSVDWFSDLRRSSGDTPWRLRSKGAYASSDTAPLPPPTPRSKAAGEDTGVEESARERAQRAIEEQERREQEELDRRRRSVAARRRAEELMSSTPAEERDTWLGRAAAEGEDGEVDLGGERARAQLRGRAQGAMTAREHQREIEAVSESEPAEDEQVPVHEREPATPPAVREQARGLGMPAEPEAAEAADIEAEDSGPKQRPHAAPWELPADYWDEKDPERAARQPAAKPVLELDHATDEQQSFAESSGLPAGARDTDEGSPLEGLDTTDAADDVPPSWETHVSRRTPGPAEERVSRSSTAEDRQELGEDAAPEGDVSQLSVREDGRETRDDEVSVGRSVAGADAVADTVSPPEDSGSATVTGTANVESNGASPRAQEDGPQAGEDLAPEGDVSQLSVREDGRETRDDESSAGRPVAGATTDGSSASAQDRPETAHGTDHTPPTHAGWTDTPGTGDTEGVEGSAAADSEVGPPVSRGSREDASAHIAAAGLGTTSGSAPETDAEDADLRQSSTRREAASDLPADSGPAAEVSSSATPEPNTAPDEDAARADASPSDHDAALTSSTAAANTPAAATDATDGAGGADGAEASAVADPEVGPPVSRGSREDASAHVADAGLGTTSGSAPETDAEDADLRQSTAADESAADAHRSQEEGLAALRSLGVDTPVGGTPSRAEADEPESARAAKPELQLDHGTGEHLSMVASSGPNRSAVEPPEAEPAPEPKPELQLDHGTGEHHSLAASSGPNRVSGSQPEADDENTTAGHEAMDPDITPIATNGFPRRGGPSREQHYPHVMPKPPLELDHATDEQRSFAESMSAPDRAEDSARRTIEEIEAAENAALLARQKAAKSAAPAPADPAERSDPAPTEAPERPARISRSGRLSRAMRSMPTGPQSEALPLDPAEVLAAEQAARAANGDTGPDDAQPAAPAERPPSADEPKDEHKPAVRKDKVRGAKPLTQLDHGTGEQSALTASGGNNSAARPPTRTNSAANSTGRPATNGRPASAKPSEPAQDRQAAETGGRKTPTSGWRRFAQAITGARNEPTLDLPQEYAERLRAPIARPQSVVVLGCTGGAGQSMTALLLGHTLASYRDDRVVAVDANPSQGGMSRRVHNGTGETLTSLLATGGDLTGYQSMRGFTTVTATGLEVVGTKDDPYVQTLDDEDYSGLVELLGRFYTISLVDPAATGVARALPVADALVLVAPASTDAARSVAMTFEWLDGHGYGGLRSRAVLVLNGVSKRTVDDVAAAERMARGQCRAVVRTPWDEHVSDGRGEVAVNSLRPITRKAYGALGGVVVAGLAASEEARR
ncbi:hypothetical protein J4H86_22385 [Spiractinospora alimapuensis]|uniref:TcpE family conjugal transfer membrane protein n=1 Tax=Spiractinospora alimapuensis TaxID=2820884 RepID=UPI001EED2C5C|nr:TcpE family conjugal transfer membrane protein [Spiractinospora alimapuensis]QVQ51514.1 hypothetical protein J4H86_22385 [Spiractinospora alimapuensis]